MNRLYTMLATVCMSSIACKVPLAGKMSRALAGLRQEASSENIQGK